MNIKTECVTANKISELENKKQNIAETKGREYKRNRDI